MWKTYKQQYVNSTATCKTEVKQKINFLNLLNLQLSAVILFYVMLTSHSTTGSSLGWKTVIKYTISFQFNRDFLGKHGLEPSYPYPEGWLLQTDAPQAQEQHIVVINPVIDYVQLSFKCDYHCLLLPFFLLANCLWLPQVRLDPLRALLTKCLEPVNAGLLQINTGCINDIKKNVNY